MPQPNTSQTILVTGAAGFIGRHLVADAVARGDSVVALGRGLGPADRPGVRAIECDLADPGLATRIADVSPAIVVHLAGETGEELSTVRSALETTYALLRSCAALPRRPRVLLASSSAVYGAHSGTPRIGESTPACPISLYGLSKAVVEALGTYFWQTVELPVICIRFFNVIGPGQSPSRVLSRFGQQLAKIEAGRQPPRIATRSLETIRDFLDVRDAVSAVRILASAGDPGQVYNVGSGRGVRVQDALDRLIALTGLSDVRVEAAPDGGIDAQQSDCRRLEALGWRPAIAFDQSLLDILDDWRARIRDQV